MSDQGDNIVHLTREVLRNGCLNNDNDDFDELRIELKMLAIKAAGLAAILSAVGSASLTHMIEETRRPINRYERVEINALVFYAARQTSISEETLQHEIKLHLSLNSTQDLSVYDYRRIREYLWERIQG